MTNNREMTGGEAVVQTLIANGISTLYCLPGIQNDAFFNALHDAGNSIRAVHTRHEQGAAYMALGAAQATGKPAVYSVVPGPGFLNTTAALATAYATNARVLCLTGQINSKAIGKGTGLLHELPDQLGILERLTKWARRGNSVAEASQLTSQAFQELTSGRPRPVGLEIPPDILAARGVASILPPLPSLPAPSLDEAAIEEAAAILKSAEHPLIFVGGGASDVGDNLKALAERLGAPVVAQRMGRGVLDDRHPLSQNIAAAHTLWRDCDVVLAIGSRVLQPLSLWGFKPGTRFIKIDIDPEEMTRLRTPDISLLGDAAAILARLLDHLRNLAPQRLDRIERSKTLKLETAKKLSYLEPQGEFLRAMRAVLPDDGVLVDESTQVGYVTRLAYEVRKPRTLLSAGYQGTLGWGFAAALGAKDALGDTPVISISGDGGFMFNVQELATAVHHKIPLVSVIFNDGAYGNVQRMQVELYGNRVIATDLTNPDFVRLGESFGVASTRAKTPKELQTALETAIASAAPALIEVPCDKMPEPWPHINMPRVHPT
jgi:acetolactate synthase-1/2/3 large subunit